MHLKSNNPGLRAAGVALGLTLLTSQAAQADDTEIFVNQGTSSGVRPNILLIIDTSGSMNDAVNPGKTPYDPSQDYAGSCDAAFAYWRRGPGSPPGCATLQRLPIVANSCITARRALEGKAGLWTGKALRWNAEQKRWIGLDPGTDEAPLECEADAGVDGESGGSSFVWARNGDTVPWTSDPDLAISWASANVHTIYSANWLNWLHAAPDNASVSRLDTVRAAARTLLYSIDGVNLGLMRFSSDGEGGMVTNPAANIATTREATETSLDAFEADSDAPTPLSETLYEAGQYLAGRAVDFGIDSEGNNGALQPSASSSRNADGTYRSPIEFACQRNFVILLTDGEPSNDSDADQKITQLPNASAINPNGCAPGTGHGRCLDEMARYLRIADLAPGAGMAGTQSAITYAIGFGPAVSGSATVQQVAAAGGGEAFAADDIMGLTNALQAIVSDIGQRSSTFTTPSVAVNAFNRTETTNELYISVFEPTDTQHWPGNLKKYGLVNGRIVDAAGNSAVDPVTGFFSSNSRSIWTTGTPDGDRVQAGGAVNLLPAPTSRLVYTFLESANDKDLTAPGNRFVSTNTAISDALLGTSAAAPTRAQIIDWARGMDVKDVNGNNNLTEPNRFMGDPLHARPALVTYGAGAQESVVFVPTNDGFLHAFAADTGRELWSFIPQEMFRRLQDLYLDPAVANRGYGLDGDVRVLRFDVDQDGVVEAQAGDRVFIYFGMRRGGRSYYALDVTDRTNPRLLWRVGETSTQGADALPGIGETWSTPTIARVRIDGAAQNGENLVLIFGGGYDQSQEDFEFRSDTSGHRIYMLDAASGKLLWYAGGPGGVGAPDLPLASMTHSIPGRVTVIDTDGNGLADRMYAADTGGRVWRFDIWNDRSADALVTGGVFANLGAAGSSNPAIEDTRRFYYAPDVALIQRRGADPYYNIAIGSGYRGHPLHKLTRDRFYSLRDKAPFTRLMQSQYNTFTPITDGELTDMTPIGVVGQLPRDTRGWKLELRLNGGWVGEKVLAEAVTINGTILFPTYQPQNPDAGSPCVPGNGLNRVYAMSVDSARPALDFNDDQAITNADAWTQLSQSGIAGEVSFALENRTGLGSGTGGVGGGGGDPNAGRDALGRRALCLVGVEVLKKCVAPGAVVRTFWQRTNTN